MDDDALIQAYLHGSEAAFEQLYGRYRQLLYNYLCSMLQEADAADAFQRTWLRVCAALPHYRADGRFLHWLLQIGRNQALDLIRRQKRRREVAETEIPEETTPPFSPEEDEALCRMLDRALEGLTEDQRVIFEMRRKGLTFRTIALQQECKVNTVVKRMQQVIRKLRIFLLDMEGKDRAEL